MHLHEVIKAFSNTVCNTSDCMCDGVVNITIKMSLYTSSQVGPGPTGTRAGRSERLCETRCSTGRDRRLTKLAGVGIWVHRMGLVQKFRM